MALVSEPDWAYLPVPILCSILDKLPEPIDHLWFGAVCKQWYSVSKDLDESSYVTLLNPFKNGISVCLPPIDLLQTYREGFDYYIYKFILSVDPASTPNNYVVVAIYDGNSSESDLPKLTILAPKMDPPRMKIISCKLTGDHFKVYKLRLHEQSGKVMERVELESLGDDTLFVGDNNSMSVSAANLPGCQPNSIYFTHDYIDWIRFNKSYRPHDVGVFNVKDGTFGQHYVLNALDKKMPPVLWIVPPFQRK
uniref:KIB1-4 beta-propeller domain-containing protein n=1 Tax=Fagus sylvatica TaxID=28930 RepID=A0A2N9F324_FAGSY